MANGKIQQSKTASKAPIKSAKPATGTGKAAPAKKPPVTGPNASYRRDAAGKF